MPGHTSAHEKASNKKSRTTSRSYSRSYNPGKGGNNVVEHTSSKKSKPSKSYSVKGTLSDPDEKKNFTSESFFKKPYSESPKFMVGPTKMLEPLFDKSAESTRRFFGDPNYKRPAILPGADGSVLSKGRYKPLSTTTNLKNYKSSSLTQSDFDKMNLTQKEESYKDYMKLRTEGKIDAYGNTAAGYRREFIVHTNKDGSKVYKEQFLKTESGPGDKTDAEFQTKKQNVVTSKNVGGTTILTTEGKVAEEKAESEEYDTRKTKRRGRRRTILTSQTGATGNLELGKKSLLGV